MLKDNLTKDKEIKVTREILEKECKIKLLDGYIYRVFYEDKMYIIDIR